jgi:hypothetical protein
LEGPAERVRLSVWSVGLTELLVVESGALSAGPHALALPSGADALPAGAFYFRVEAFAGGRHAEPRIGKFMRLR